MTNLLIIEDDPDLIELLTHVLGTSGFVIEAVLDGEGGLALLGKKTFDLILLDIMLPSVDGFEVCRRIKAAPRSKNTPVIAVTALSIPGIAEKALKAGADDIILKPFEPSALIEKMKKVLSAPKQ